MDDKTFVPGMNDQAKAYHPNSDRNTRAYTNYSQMAQPQSAKVQPQPQAPKVETPVVGFLYSISRKGIGEYWPLYLGQNHIGRAANNEIQLHEGTISDMHACLSVKKMHSTGRLIASIRDIGSKTGMYLNDEELDYDNHTCKNGDLVTIGSNYQLLIILIEAAEYGLTISNNFVSVDEEAQAPVNTYSQPAPQPAARPAKPNPVPHSVENNFNPYSGNNRRFAENATIDLNGMSNDDFGGNTELL